MTLTYFFHSNFSRAVWFSARPLFRSSFLPYEQDGVQATLGILISHSTSDEIMQKILTILWYIWKARNDLRFRKQKWSVLQVHYATQAHISLMISAYNKAQNQQHNEERGTNFIQVRNSCQAGDLQRRSTLELQALDHSTIAHRTTQLLMGFKCYTDASIPPDFTAAGQKRAGLGIFMYHPTRKEKLFIKAQLPLCESVLMAEAAALALAAKIASFLQIDEITFLTDNQILADLFSGGDTESPPDWRIKAFTQTFIDASKNRVVHV
jgi:hypothetical protein